MTAGCCYVARAFGDVRVPAGCLGTVVGVCDVEDWVPDLMLGVCADAVDERMVDVARGVLAALEVVPVGAAFSDGGVLCVPVPGGVVQVAAPSRFSRPGDRVLVDGFLVRLVPGGSVAGV